MDNTVLINFERENISGNVLDIGFENYGIIYNLYKEGYDEINVEYLSGREDKEKLQEEFYDTCIVFFTLSEMWLKHIREKFISDISKYLKKDGVIYIWDKDKQYGKIFESKLRIVMPGRKIKSIKLKDYNIAKDTSYMSTKKIVEKYFEIIDSKCSNNIYCIKGKKRGSKTNEGTTSRG